MTCEDFPCCGHTDGLGCDWVSPNEVQLCLACADARANYPYHSHLEVCPTQERAMREDVPADALCECGEEASLRLNANDFLCSSCWVDEQEWHETMLRM